MLRYNENPSNHISKRKVMQVQWIHVAAGIPAGEWAPGLELLAEVAVEWHRAERGMRAVLTLPSTNCVSLVCNWAPPLGLTCTSVENNRLEKCFSILTPKRRLEGDQELKVISLSYIVNFSSVWGLRYMRPCLKTHACMHTHTHTCTLTHSLILTMVRIKFQYHNQQ